MHLSNERQIMAINLATPTGPRLRSLPLEEGNALRAQLNEWLDWALEVGPDNIGPRDIPMNYTRALADMAKYRGIKISFDRGGRHHGAMRKTASRYSNPLNSPKGKRDVRATPKWKG